MSRRRREGLLGIAGVGLLLLALVLANRIAARHAVRLDWTRARVFSLSAKSISVIKALKRKVEITVFMVPPARLGESIYPETRELLRRFSRISKQIVVRYVDMDNDPTKAQLLAKRYGVYKRELRAGVVILASARRSRYVPAREMAEYGKDGRLLSFSGEAALLEALIAVASEAPQIVCFSTGHGEAVSSSYAAAGYGYLADEIKRDGFRVQTLIAGSLIKGAPGCHVLLIGGPQRPFAQVELDGLDRFMRRGGRLLLLIGPVLDRRVRRYGNVGLERWLKQWGVTLPKNIVLDPRAVPGEQPLMTWGTRDGYAGHPIARAISSKLTIWRLCREVRLSAKSARPGARAWPLVQSGTKSWAETDLASLRGERPLSFDARVDSRGPVSVAAAGVWRRARWVVIGSERSVLNRRIDSGDYSRDLVLGAVSWLANQRARVAVGPKRPEHLRLKLDEAQLRRVFLISVVALPLSSLFFGFIVWRRRRSG